MVMVKTYHHFGVLIKMIKEKINNPYCKGNIGSEARTYTIRVVEPLPPEETKSMLLLAAAAAIGLFAIWIYTKRR